MMFYAADYRRLARENLRGNWWLSIAVVFMATLLGGTVGGTSFFIKIPETLLPLIKEHVPGLIPLAALSPIILSGLFLVQIILGGAVALGNAQYHLNQYDKKPLTFKTLFSKFDQFGASLCLNLLTGLYSILWGLVPMIIGFIIGLLLDLMNPWYGLLLVIVFLIPFAVACYSYSMSFYIMTEYPEMGANKAIRASRDLMRGRKWELFCLTFSFIGWHILTMLTLGIGNLFLGPYISSAYAAFYRQIKSPREINGLQHATVSPEERNLSL